MIIKSCKKKKKTALTINNQGKSYLTLFFDILIVTKNKAVEKTSRWYSDYLDIKKVNTFKDLADYIEDAKSNQIVWTK